MTPAGGGPDRAGRRSAYSVLITPLASGTVRQLSVDQWVLRVGLVGAAIVVALALSSVWSLSRTAQQNVQLRELAAERDSLRAALERVDQLERELVALSSLGDRVREIAGVDAAPGRQINSATSQAAVQEPPLGVLNHRPATGPISRGFGDLADDGRAHSGVDLAGAEGDSVVAAGDGRVVAVDVDADYGNRIVIDHGADLITIYGHNRDVIATNGSSVHAGQLISHLGSTGRSSAPHLHFEVRLDGVPVNPVTHVACAWSRTRKAD